MFGAIFYVYKKEVQKMNDLIELKLITREDAECLHKLQIEAFMPLYEKYQDDATSPAKESLETITKKIVDDNSDFYFILFNGEKAGAVRVKWHKGQKVHKNVNWISPIFIIPHFQNKGIASNVIKFPCTRTVSCFLCIKHILICTSSCLTYRITRGI